jgi:FixJ family two-component response regulator
MRGCIILDLQMPELTGLNVQTALNDRKNSLPIIFLTGKGDIPTTVSAMKAGASDFLTKPASEATLLGAINRALETDRQAHAQRVELAKLRALFARLTPRETEVLRYVVQGYLNKQTAAELGTVEKTIKVHRARLMDKLEVESLAELVRMVEHAGIFENHQ